MRCWVLSAFLSPRVRLSGVFLMGVMEAKAKRELARASSIWLHGLVLSIEFGRVEVFGILGWSGAGKDGSSQLGVLGSKSCNVRCQFLVRSRSSVELGAKFSSLVRREVSESVRSRSVS